MIIKRTPTDEEMGKMLEMVQMYIEDIMRHHKDFVITVAMLMCAEVMATAAKCNDDFDVDYEIDVLRNIIHAMISTEEKALQ